MNNEKTIVLSVAGFRIRINLLPTEWLYSKNAFIKEVKNYYNSFISIDDKTECHYTIDVIEQRNFVFYKQKNIGLIELFKQKKSNYITTYYQLSIIQFQLLINSAIHYLLEKHGGCILHASANRVENSAVLFLGPSGQGKSTIMSLLHRTYPALADDSIIIRKINSRYLAFQTPTKEKESWVQKTSASYPFQAIYFLGEKSSVFKINKLIDKSDILKTLAAHLIVGGVHSRKYMLFLLDLLKSNLFYSIQFLKKQNQLIDFFNEQLKVLDK